MWSGAPVCHRKIPSLHSFKVLEPSNLTDTTLHFSHPENLEQWPGSTTSQELVTPASKNVEEEKPPQQKFHYRLRQLGAGNDNGVGSHFAVHFFPEEVRQLLSSSSTMMLYIPPTFGHFSS